MKRFAIFPRLVPIGLVPVLLAPVALGALLRPCAAQTPPPDLATPGFAIQATRPVGVSDAYATLTNGNRVDFDGVSVDLVADDGTLIHHLADFPHYFYPGFVLAYANETAALVSEIDRGKISRVDLVNGGRVVISDLDYNYDAAWEDAGHVLVSASPAGPFINAGEIYRIDVATGVQTLVANVGGPSGPLAFDTQGNLYYARLPDNFGPTTILRFTPAQLSSGAVLTVPDATVFATGLAGASSMRFDRVYGHLFVAAPVYNSASSVVEIAGDGSIVGDVITTTNWISNVEFLYGPGPGSFQAFQPANGVTLKVRTTDYPITFTSRIQTVRPVRPIAATSGPGLSGPGPVTFTVSGAHPNASFLVMVGFTSAWSPVEQSYDVGTYLFHTGMPINAIRRLVYVSTDSAGAGSWTFNNPAGLQGQRVLQAMIQDPSGHFIGSSTAAFN